MNSTRYQVVVDSVTPSEWVQLLSHFEDANIYQTLTYGKVRWGEHQLSHLVLKKNQAIVAGCQVRIIRPKFVKGGIAYVRWGPLVKLKDRSLELEDLRQMAFAMHTEYVQKRGLLLRIVPNVFRGSEYSDRYLEVFSQFGFKPAFHLSVERTFLVDLAPSLEILRKQLDQKWRNQLNRAEKNEMQVVVGNGRDEYRTFVAVYREMWQRKKFDTSVDVNEFDRICDELPEPLRFRVLTCFHQGIPVSAVVCSALGATGIYLLGATSDAGLQAKGGYLLQWEMIKWLKVNGFKHYDLGGIDPVGNPGVYHFKSGLAGKDVSRLAPLQCCESLFSQAFTAVADSVRGGLRGQAANYLKWLSKAIKPIGGRQSVEVKRV